VKVRRWQDSKGFVRWLIKMQYAYREGTKIRHHFGSDGKSDGIILYMWEAWRAGRHHQQKLHRV
jgi:hypothetical protein